MRNLLSSTLLDSGGGLAWDGTGLLGHSSAEVTRDVYLHSVPADAKEAVQKVENLIGPKWTQIPVIPELTNTLIRAC